MRPYEPYIALQALLSTGFGRQEYWSGLPYPSNPGIKPESLVSPALAGRFLTTSTTWEAPMRWGESESHSVVSDSLRPHGLYSPWNSPGQNIGVGSLSLFQKLFPTQGLSPGPMHCEWILYQLSHRGSP